MVTQPEREDRGLGEGGGGGARLQTGTTLRCTWGSRAAQFTRATTSTRNVAPAATRNMLTHVRYLVGFRALRIRFEEPSRSAAVNTLPLESGCNQGPSSATTG